MLVLPRHSAPAASKRSTVSALFFGRYANSGHAAVVGMPATSMLSFTPNGMPHSGGELLSSNAPKAFARASSSALGTRWIHTFG
jgi:hypothetical protein